MIWKLTHLTNYEISNMQTHLSFYHMAFIYSFNKFLLKAATRLGGWDTSMDKTRIPALMSLKV